MQTFIFDTLIYEDKGFEIVNLEYLRRSIALYSKTGVLLIKLK